MKHQKTIEETLRSVNIIEMKKFCAGIFAGLGDFISRCNENRYIWRSLKDRQMHKREIE